MLTTVICICWVGSSLEFNTLCINPKHECNCATALTIIYIVVFSIIHYKWYAFRSPVVLLDDKTLRLAQRFSAQGAESIYQCALLGSINVDPGKIDD